MTSVFGPDPSMKPETERVALVANASNLAYVISEVLRTVLRNDDLCSVLTEAGFKNVTDIEVYHANQSVSGMSAAFTIVMSGPDLNKDTAIPYDKRRIFTVRVSQS